MKAIETPADGDATVGPPAPGSARTWRTGTLTYTRSTLVGLFSWLLWGDFATYLRDRSIGKIQQVIFQQYHMSALAVAFLTGTLPVILNFAIGPAVAYHSDRHRGSRGRRIPYLLGLLPLVMAAATGLAFSPQIGSALDRILGSHSPGPHATGVAVVTLFVTLVGLTVSLTYWIFLALITDVVPREWFGRFFAWFRVVSLMAGVLFDWYIMGLIPRHWSAILVCLGGVFCVSFAAMCLNVKEGEYPPLPAPASSGPGRIGRFAAGARAYCRDCLGHPYYRWFFAAAILAQVAIGPWGIYDVFLATSYGTSLAQYGKFGALQAVISMVISYATGSLVDRFHPLRVTIVALAMVSVAAGAAFFLVRDAMGFGVSVVICGALSGFWYTAQSSLGSQLFPRLKFATYNTGMQTTIQVGLAIANFTAGWIIDAAHQEYRLVYAWWATCTFLSFCCTLVVYRYFLRYGGVKSYAPPS